MSVYYLSVIFSHPKAQFIDKIPSPTNYLNPLDRTALNFIKIKQQGVCFYFIQCEADNVLEISLATSATVKG